MVIVLLPFFANLLLALAAKYNLLCLGYLTHRQQSKVHRIFAVW